jgi:integrase
VTGQGSAPGCAAIRLTWLVAHRQAVEQIGNAKREDLATLLIAPPDGEDVAWALAIACGMRRGELAGLKWSKVDSDIGVVHVHWQRAVASGAVAGGVVEKEPKGKSRRSIAIGSALVALLREHQLRQQAEAERAGAAYRRGQYVFCNEDGAPYHPKFFTDRFRELCGTAGVPVIVLHDARHSSATVGAVVVCRSTRCSGGNRRARLTCTTFHRVERAPSI